MLERIEGAERENAPRQESGALTAARRYLGRGWRSIPIPFRSKAPLMQGWQKLRLEESDLPLRFGSGPSNLGVLLGEPSGWLIDIDLDHLRCVALADHYLPPTPAVFGRPGKPRSHRIYRVSGPVATTKHRSKSAGMLVELRSTGAQTVFPPSVHESGEAIMWDDEEAEPALVDPEELLAAVKHLAEAVKVELGERPAPKQARCQKPNDSPETGRPDGEGGPETSDRAGRCLQAVLRINMVDQQDGSSRLFAAACRCVEHDLAEEQAIAVIREYASQRPFPVEWSDDQILQRIRDAEPKCARGSANTAAEDESPEGERETQSAILVRLAESAELFHHDEEAFASVRIAGHRETHRLKSKAFRSWLMRKFYESTRRVPNSQALQDALGMLYGQAMFDGPSHPIAVRMAELEGAYWIDLGDDDWRAVRINASGWQIVASDAVPVRFVRRKAMRALPIPVAGGSVNELRRFINVRDETDWVLLLGWLVAALRPSGPFPILLIIGEPGTAKSTMSRLLRALIDPNKAPLRSEPKDDRDLMIAASNSWLVVFDNLSTLPVWLSNAICRMATGGGFSTRELYTDDGEIVFDVMRPVVLNGVEGVTSRPDLPDRAVTLTLQPIPESQRRTEKELWIEFEQAQPRIFGALLSAMSVAMRGERSVKLPCIPRMADFAVWVTAAEPGLELPEGSFLRAYQNDRATSHQTILDGSLVGRAIIGLVASAGTWRGTPSELLAELNSERRSNEPTRRASEWPKNARKLAGDLRYLAPSLRATGISVTIPDRRTGRTKRLEIVLEKAPEPRSASSANEADDPGTADSVRTVADDEPSVDVPRRSASIPSGGPETPNAERADHADRRAPYFSDCEGAACAVGVDSDPGAFADGEARPDEEVFEL